MLQPAHQPAPCACFSNAQISSEGASLRLLSEIPSQSVYRCQKCQAFLAFHKPSQTWDVIVPGVQRKGAKTLY